MAKYFWLPLAFVVVELSAAAAVSAPLHVRMNDPAILYSPYNWLVESSRAKTINPGANVYLSLPMLNNFTQFIIYQLYI